MKRFVRRLISLFRRRRLDDDLARDPALPVDSVMTMEERVASSLSGPRTYALFLVGFALCALAIAGVGLFGVPSYTTAQRTREIGWRTALGARRGDVLTLVSCQAIGMTMVDSRRSSSRRSSCRAR